MLNVNTDLEKKRHGVTGARDRAWVPGYWGMPFSLAQFRENYRAALA
jgi:hypothetical protein